MKEEYLFELINTNLYLNQNVASFLRNVDFSFSAPMEMKLATIDTPDRIDSKITPVTDSDTAIIFLATFIKMNCDAPKELKEIALLRQYTGLPFRQESSFQDPGKILATVKIDSRIKKFVELSLQDYSSYSAEILIETMERSISIFSSLDSKSSDNKIESYSLPMIDPNYYHELNLKLSTRQMDSNLLFDKISNLFSQFLERIKKSFILLAEKGIINLNLQELITLEKLTLSTENYLSILLFLLDGSEIKENIFKKHFKDFFELLKLILLEVCPYSVKFKKEISSHFSLIAYLPIENIYILNQLMHQYFNINLRLLEKNELYFFIERACHIMRYHPKALTLSLNEFEILFLSLYEEIQQTDGQSVEDLADLDFLAFTIYSLSGDTRAALNHYEQSYQILFNFFLERLNSKSFNLSMPNDFCEDIVKVLSNALKENILPPKNIDSKCEELISFICKFNQLLSTLAPKNSYNMLVNPAHYQFKLLMDKLFPDLRSIQKICRERNVKPSKNRKHNSLPKIEVVPKKIEEYKMAVLTPQRSPIISIFNLPPPVPTLRISDEEIERGKQLKYKKNHNQKKSKLLNSMNSASSSSSSDSSSLCSLSTSDSPIRQFLNPITKAVLYAQINFSQMGKIISNDMMDYMNDLLEKGRIGLGKGKIKPVNGVERMLLAERYNKNICFKLKGEFQALNFRCYGYFLANNMIEFGIFCQAHKGKEKHLQKCFENKNSKKDFS